MQIAAAAMSAMISRFWRVSVRVLDAGDGGGGGGGLYGDVGDRLIRDLATDFDPIRFRGSVVRVLHDEGDDVRALAGSERRGWWAAVGPRQRARAVEKR